jgi:heme o synthase
MSSQPSSALLTNTSSSRLKDYVMLMKLRLSSSVVFSSLTGYLLGAHNIIVWEIIALILGGILVTGAANAFNQLMEKEQDALMSRTENRPIASGRLSIVEGLIIAFVLLISGSVLLLSLNFLTFIFGLASVVLYALVYTPLKGKSAFAVFVGAFPGAIPIMLGWVAATNSFGVEPGTLFAWQFLWQFPHFWAIAWLLHKDYLKAGYVLLPSGNPDRRSAFQALLYSAGLMLLILLPYLGLAGSFTVSGVATIIIALMGLILIFRAFLLFKRLDNSAARKLMLYSIFYLTVTQIVWVIDHFISR